MYEMQQAAPAEGAAAQGGDPTEALFQMGDALTQLGGAIIGAGSVAPEAQQALETSIASYQDFLKIMGGGQAAGPSSQDSMSAGAKGAMQADMPTGKNMKAVPA